VVRCLSRCLSLLPLAILAPSAASAAFLYGVTATDLVVIETTDPSLVRVIGPHGLVRSAVYLTWDPVRERLFGLATEELSPAPLVLDYDLVEYDLATGAGSLVRNLGRTDVVGAFEILEYVDSQSSLVLSRDNSGDFLTTELNTLDPDTGAFVPLVDVGFDNDFGVYDDVRDILYVWDPNNTGLLQTIDLVGGGVTNIAPTGAMDRDGAFSEEDGGIFVYELTSDTLVNIETTDGGAPINRVTVGVVDGPPITGLAFAPVPEPAAPALVLCGALVLAGRRVWASRTPTG
jgi:hypothetical protein